jgi:TP901 family phage tail tape measure protein
MANYNLSILLSLINQASGPLAAAEGQLKKFSEAAKKIGGEMQALGAKMALAGAPAVMAGKAAIETQRDLLAIANTAGLLPDAAKKAAEAWKKEINAIARATNQTQVDLSGALGALVSKGMDPEQALKMLRPIGDAATATGGQISDIARTLYSTYDNLKTPIGEAAKTLDVLATAGNKGAFELKDMAQYFPQMSAAAGLLKMHGIEASASLAAAGQIAMKGAGDASTAANNLQNFLLKLTAPDTVKKFDEAGKNLSAEMKKGLASGDLIGYMANLINEMTGGDAEKISDLFGDMQVKMFLAPMLANMAEYKEIRDAALDAVGTIDQQKTTILQATSEKLKGSMIGLNAAMEESKIFQGALEGIKNVAEWFAANPEAFGTLATAISALAIGGTGLVLAGTAISAIGTAVGVIGTAWGAAAAAFASISAFAAVMGTAAGAAALTAAGTALAAIAGVVAAWKVGFAFGTWINDQINVAITALTGGKNKDLGTLIYDMVQAFKGIGPKMYKVGSDIIDGLWKGIQANIRKPLDAIGDLSKKLPEWAKELLGIHSPSRVFMEIGENIGDGMAIGIDASTAGAGAAAKRLAEVVVVEPTSAPRNADGKFKSAADAAAQGTGFSGGLAEYVASVKTASDAMKDATVHAFKGMEDALTNYVMTGKLKFTDLTNSIISDMVRMMIQQSITKPLATMAMGFFGMTASAKGNVYSGPGISAYSNTIVSKPTFFANGGNVMGEAGPEAIVPLKRGPDGVLGVRGGGSNVVVNQSFNIDARGADDGAVARIESAMRNLSANFKPMAQQAVREAMLRNRSSPSF